MGPTIRRLPFPPEKLCLIGAYSPLARKRVICCADAREWILRCTPTMAKGTPAGASIRFDWVLEERAIQDVYILPGFFYGTTLLILSFRY